MARSLSVALSLLSLAVAAPIASSATALDTATPTSIISPSASASGLVLKDDENFLHHEVGGLTGAQWVGALAGVLGLIGASYCTLKMHNSCVDLEPVR